MSLKVEIKRVTKVKPHPNANNLEIIEAGGKTCVVQKDTFREGDKCVLFPQHSVLTSDTFNKIFYDVSLKSRDTRIRRIRLRGVDSEALAVDPELFDLHWLEPGADVTTLLGVTEFKPKQQWSESDIDVSFINVFSKEGFFAKIFKKIFG